MNELQVNVLMFLDLQTLKPHKPHFNVTFKGKKKNTHQRCYLKSCVTVDLHTLTGVFALISERRSSVFDL